MSAISTIKVSSILDGIVKTTSATVGVDETFSPVDKTNGVARWENRAVTTPNPLGVAIGFPTMSLSIRPPSKSSRVYKVTVKLVSPTLEQTSASTATGIQPAPTLAYNCAAFCDFLLPERSTLAERTAFLNRFASLFAGTITASDAAPSDSTGSPLVAAVQNFERPY